MWVHGMSAVSHFAGAAADEVTVYVLFGLENNPNCARFFVTGTATW